MANTGAGHRSAANAIGHAIKLLSQDEQEHWYMSRQASLETVEPSDSTSLSEDELSGTPPPTYHIEIVDVFEEYSVFPLREVTKLYGPTIRVNPKLYGEFFMRMDREEAVKALTVLGTPMILSGLIRLFTTVRPDIIVSVHPVINYVTLHALEILGLPIPFLTVVTDLISVHSAWFAPGARAYVVPTEQAKRIYLAKGRDPSVVHVLGMPIHPKFTQESESREQLRERFGLKRDLPVVLLVGGGEGAGGLYTAVRAISQARLAVQLLVVTGRNKELFARLRRILHRLHVPVKLFGFVENMPELMRASDVIVTKAGPGTICEALACGLPIILSGYVPGQESGNVEFVVQNDVGVLAEDPMELVDELRRLLKPGSPVLRRRRENAIRLSRPRAAFEIAQFILGYLPPPGEPSIWQMPRWRKRLQRRSQKLRPSLLLRRVRRRLPSLIAESPLLRLLTQLGLEDLDLRVRDRRYEKKPENEARL